MKYEYDKLKIILFTILIIGIWCGIFDLSFKINKTGAFIFLSIFSLIMILLSLLTFSLAFSSIKNSIAIETDEKYLQYNLHRIQISYNDISDLYIYRSPAFNFLIIKIQDFETHYNLISNSLIGQIHLLNYRTFGKSLIFINLSFIKGNEKDILKQIKKYVHKR